MLVWRRPAIISPAPSSVAKSVYLYFYSFFLQDYGADLHQIFQEDGKWVALEKLSFCFVNFFMGGMDVQKVTFASDPALQNAAWQKNGFTYRKKDDSPQKAVRF